MADIVANLRYLQWQKLYEIEKPFMCFLDAPEDADDSRDNNLVFADQETRLTDVRPYIGYHTLDDNGFKVLVHTSEVKEFDKHNIETRYLPEVETLLRDQFGPLTRIFFFDWRVSEGGIPFLGYC
jgi:hypothetical protein